MSENQLSNKVFVGNVPFQCTREEFQDCFKDLDGFVTADIIMRYKSKLSRGFGFVVFQTPEQAQELIGKTDINLKDRTLRFSPYNNEDKEKMDNGHLKHYHVFVRNLENGTSNEQLKEVFSDFNPSTCFVNFKNNKTTGIVIVESYEDYKKILNNPPTVNDVSLDVKPFKRPNKRPPGAQYTNARVAYREGFRAGHMVGFQQGFQQGLYHKKNTSDENNADTSNE